MAHLPKGQGVFLPPFKAWLASNIPAVYDNTMTYYEELCALIKYLQDVVIPALNHNAEAVTTIATAVEQLQKYVEDYFKNLDVQEEINNKLDEMAEAGTLQEIIGEYLNATAVWGFDSVADMKSSTNLIEGSYARTLGYYSVNDGGEATYKIRKVTNDDTVDEAFLIEIGDPADELVAELIIDDNTVNIRQLGGRSQKTDGTKYDIKSYIEKYITFNDAQTNSINLYIPSGVWTSTALTITTPKGFNIFGDFGYSEYRFDSTILTTYANNQTHLLKIGTNEGTYVKNYSLKNIIFSTYDWAWDSDDKMWKPDTAKSVSGQVINMLYAIHGKLENIFCIYCIGECMRITCCWENIFSYLAFRFVSNPTGSILCFSGDNSHGSYAGVSSSDFERIYFEKCHGDLIEVKSQANVYNNHFGIINVEPNRFNPNNDFTYTNLDASDLPAGMKHYYILKLSEASSNMVSNKIESIELNGMAMDTIAYNGNVYAYDSILFTGDSYQYFNNVIGSIVSTSTHKDIVLYKNTSTNLFNSGDSALIIQSVLIDSNFDYVFDVTNTFPVIKVGGEMKGKGGVTKVASNLITFQECIQSCASNGAMNNCITSDSGALSPTKLCFRPWSYLAFTVGGSIVTGANKIYVHAKADADTTFKLNLRNEDDSHGQELSFAGDGTWKWYEFNLNEYIGVIGQKCWFRSQNANNRNVLLDTFFFA